MENLAEWPEISRHIWDVKYRYRQDGQPLDATVESTWRRVARASASVEASPDAWEERFYHDLLAGFRFLPGGRIVANAGTGRLCTTMFNCYVMGTIDDSIDGIFDVVKESALTQKQGGGVGYDFSTIRPRGSHIRGVDSPASGPISFMKVLDATCRTIMSAGQRRGAQMGIMRCDHPDIVEFVKAKREDGALRMFNLSVAVTDGFIEAVKGDDSWDLVFEGKVHTSIRARELWDMIMRSTYDFAEPGVFMVDRVNHWNNLSYCERITATNPCGEQPLPPYGACLLGSINLTQFVQKPFEKHACLDFKGIDAVTRLAVRFLDNVIELSNYPLERQRDEALRKRRMGIGLTGLADALIFLGIPYGSEEAGKQAEHVMKTITHAAYDASAALAGEKGAFPELDIDKYLSAPFVSALPGRIREKIKRHGIRNSHLTSIAPTGTISLLAGNISSGVEPVFAYHYVRRIRQGDAGQTAEYEVMDYAYAEYCRRFARPADDSELPSAFVTTDQVSPDQHLLMQAALQKYVDSSISKTVNVDAGFPFEAFKNIYLKAYDLGLKGCTTFRPSEHIAGVLIRQDDRTSSTSDSVSGALPDRPLVLTGTTYKIKTPLTPDAFYVTINDIEEEGAVRPYEIFINTKNLQHFSWIVAMTRLISAVFRRERDPSFLIEELKSIYDPTGGYFSGGEYVPSLPAELGRVIASHLKRLGIVAEEDSDEGPSRTHEGEGAVSLPGGLGICPVCHQPGLLMEENCVKCRFCDYSKCG